MWSQKTKMRRNIKYMDCRERGSHARGVYPTQDTSRMRGTLAQLTAPELN